MLVLSRKADQKIQIGDEIVITVLEVKGNTVRIGIEAPRNIRVLRGELGVKKEDRPIAEVGSSTASLALPMKRGSGSQSTSLRQAPADRREAEFDVDRGSDRPQVMRFPVAEASVDVRTESADGYRPLRVRTAAAPR